MNALSGAERQEMVDENRQSLPQQSFSQALQIQQVVHHGKGLISNDRKN